MSLVKSKAQWALFQGICNGTYPDGYRGISKAVACEYIRNSKEIDILKLAEHVKKKKE